MIMKPPIVISSCQYFKRFGNTKIWDIDSGLINIQLCVNFIPPFKTFLNARFFLRIWGPIGWNIFIRKKISIYYEVILISDEVTVDFPNSSHTIALINIF